MLFTSIVYFVSVLAIPGAMKDPKKADILIGWVALALALLTALAAAKLSYTRYASFGWALVAFLFSEIYIPYYAFFVNQAPTLFGGRRR
jgi:hypothetical protein